MICETQQLTLSVSCFLLLVASALLWTLARRLKKADRKNKRHLQDRRAMSNFLNRFAYSVSGGGADLNNAIISVGKFIRESVHAESLCIFFTDEDKPERLVAETTIGPFPHLCDFEGKARSGAVEDLNRKIIYLDKGFLGKVAKCKKSLLINDPRSDIDLHNIGPDSGIHSVIVIPIVFFDELKGVICAVNSTASEGKFSSEDLQLLESISNNITLSRSMMETFNDQHEQQRISQELEFARTIQQTLIPETLPQIAGMDIFACNRPAKEVSGDFYDSISIDENRQLIVLADASGKGVPACLIMTMTRSVLRSICSNFLSLEELLLELNDYLVRDTEMHRFVTMVFCLIDEKANTLELARAGHTEILLRNRFNDVYEINPDGPAIGLIPNEVGLVFDTFAVSLSEGYSLMFYSDGLTEAENDDREEFGQKRLVEAWRHQEGNSEQAVEGILGEVAAFAGDMPQLDDQTLLIINVNEIK